MQGNRDKTRHREVGRHESFPAMSHYDSSDLNPMFSQTFTLPLEEGDAWQPQQIYGDFYRETTEHVTRGVTLSSGTFEGSDPTFGDFYRPDDVFKGVSMSPFPGGFGEFGGWIPDEPKDLTTNYDIGHDRVPYLSKVTSRFEQSHWPPFPPSDDHFKLEVTTLFLRSLTPFDIGNQILEFLSSKVESSINKVNHKKFSIKADVFVDSVMCALKIRTYCQKEDTYAVEFQRRSGDCVSFQNAFQQACKFLKAHFHQPVSENPKDVIIEESPPLTPWSATPEISPLLDMASLVHSPSLQAESATALAGMAQDSQVAPFLCTGSAFKEFKKLLQNDNTDVAYPTARMLSLLSKHPEACAFFQGEGLLLIMVEKVRSSTTSALVREKLADVLRSALRGCAGALDETERSEVKAAIALALQEEAMSEKVRQMLEEAEQLLQFAGF